MKTCFIYTWCFSFMYLFSACTQTTENETVEQNKNNESPKAVLVKDTRCLLGEGAVWNHTTGELYFVDIEKAMLHVLQPGTGQLKNFSTGKLVGTVVPAQNGNAVVACQNGIFELDLDSGNMTLIAEPEKDRNSLRMNDGKCDPAGRLWVGSMHFDQVEYAASLYRIETDGSWARMLDSITVSNGIVWSNDEKTLYYIDTPTQQVQAFDYDKESGNITNGRIAVEVPDTLGYPDGMAIDEDGSLWIAMWNGNCVTRWNPTNGTLLQKIEIPAHNVTSCAFGGANLDTLFITSARIDMTEEELKTYPAAGGVFAIVPGVKGVNASFFGKKE